MFHISDIKKYRKCPRLFFLSQNTNSEFQPFLRNDEILTNLIIKYLKLDNYYLGVKGDNHKRVLNELNKYEWFVKSRFEFNDLRVKIPFLHKVKNGFDVYFALYALYPHEDDLEFYRNNIWVLEKNGIKINSIYIIHLNANYILEDKLDVDKLFITSDSFYNFKNNPSSLIKDRLYQKINNPSSIINYMKNSSLTDYNAVKKKSCKAKNICNFYYECFKDEEVVSDDSILHLVSSQYKNQMFIDGRKHLKDADLELLEGTRCQYAQIAASKNGGLFFDYYPLKTWMENLKLPIAFIDFEWERYIVPPFKGLKPYDVVCFEYSLHLLDEKGELKHTTFIGTKDCREDFVKSLLKDIPYNATIVAYNAQGAEMLRIKELALQLPEYADKLNRLLNHFVDMSFPFLSGIVYDLKMRGNFSVKSLLKVVSNLKYDNLDIHDGMSAVYKWRIIDRETKDINTNEIKQSLIEYCSMDSYALYLIYKWLVEILDNKKPNICNTHK